MNVGNEVVRNKIENSAMVGYNSRPVVTELL